MRYCRVFSLRIKLVLFVELQESVYTKSSETAILHGGWRLPPLQLSLRHVGDTEIVESRLLQRSHPEDFTLFGRINDNSTNSNLPRVLNG